MDLDLVNYDFNDLLNLFKLENDFTLQEFKDSKNTVYALHPDKSCLDKKFFIFFLDAYKLLLKVAEFKFKNHNIDIDKDYYSKFENIKNDFFDEKEQLIANKFTYDDNFNEKFNELFEKHYNSNNNLGYGEWLKSSNEDEIDYDKIKKISRELTLNKEIETYSFNSSIGFSIGNNIIDNPEIDLKHVYTTGSVIGVNEEDLEMGRKQKTIKEIKNERNKNIIPHDYETCNRIINTNKEKENIESSTRIYNLLVEEENNIKNNVKFWANLKQLKN